MKKKILVLIPCLNEEATLGNVIKNVRKYLPESRIVVYDNNSSDKTSENEAIPLLAKSPSKTI